QAGFDAQLRLVPAQRLNNDNELKATYPAWRNNYGLTPQKFYGPNIAAIENSWRGTNKLGWTNSENDRLVELWNRSLDFNEQNQLMVQAYRNLNEDLPGLPLYYNFTVTAHTSDIQGPTGAVPNTTAYGNLHQWQWLR